MPNAASCPSHDAIPQEMSTFMLFLVVLSGEGEAVGCADPGTDPSTCAASATASVPLLLLFTRLISGTAVSRVCVG